VGRSFVERCGGGSELILAPCEESVTRRDEIVMLAGGEEPPGKEERGDDAS
jgi:hypothetical protein